jgi:membrane protease YdiL (CAAX protease family)
MKKIFFIIMLGNLISLFLWVIKLPLSSDIFYYIFAFFIYAYLLIDSLSKERSKVNNIRLKYLVICIALGIVFAIIPIMGLKIGIPVNTSNIDFIKGYNWFGIIYRVFFVILFLTAIPEELLFRENLYTITQVWKFPKIILINALIFTLWHIIVILRIVSETIQSNTIIISSAYIGTLISIFLAGLIYSYIRYKFQSWIYPMITHWITVGLMTFLFWSIA